VAPPEEAAVRAGGGVIGGRAGVTALRGMTGVAAFPLAADGDGIVADVAELTLPVAAIEAAPDLGSAVPPAEDELEFTKRCEEGS
jgi:hypothetical protein